MWTTILVAGLCLLAGSEAFTTQAGTTAFRPYQMAKRAYTCKTAAKWRSWESVQRAASPPSLAGKPYQVQVRLHTTKTTALWKTWSQKSRADVELRMSSTDAPSAGGFTLEQAQTATFSQAQEIGVSLGRVLTECTQKGKPLPSEAGEVLRALLSHSDGARGFYVTTLTLPECEGAFAGVDQGLLDAIVAAPDPNVKLLSMNIAMSTATELAHKANGNPDLAAGSATTRERTKTLIKAVLPHMPQLEAELLNLLAAAAGEEGEEGGGIGVESYKSFCERWGYGAEQKKAIVEQVRLALA